MRRFNLHPRNGIYYAQMVDPETRRRLSAKSTGQRDRDEALLVVAGWLKDGLPVGRKCSPRRDLKELLSVRKVLDSLQSLPLTKDDVSQVISVFTNRGLLLSATVAQTPGSVLFEDYLLQFWDFEKSTYVQEKLAHGLPIRLKHCKTSSLRAKKYWIPFLKGKHLSDLTRDDIKSFCIHISIPELGLAAATRNRILVVGTTALKWAFATGKIPVDITAGVMGL